MKLSILISAFLCLVIKSWACCMVPATYKGTIKQDAHEAVLIHDNGREELILRINYRIKGEKMPANFAWVITTPNEPDSYALADKKIFPEMFGLSQRFLAPRYKSENGAKSAKADSKAAPGIVLGKRVQVGPYDIQPIRGVGPNALKGLNGWLSKNGYPTEQAKLMSYFVKKNFTFLCVKIRPGGKNNSVNNSGFLPPLHLSFKSKMPYYPLRFSSRQGVFNVNLHVLTRTKLNYTYSDKTFKKINWMNKRFKRNFQIDETVFPEALKKAFKKSVWKDKVGKWYYNNIRCTRVNTDHSIVKWTKDVYFVTN